MASATRTWLPQSHALHVFDQLQTTVEKQCEACHEERAVFLWTQHRDGQLLDGKHVAVCRVCAGMILLISRDE